MERHEHEIELISLAIQRYIFSHPNAADTLEGITKWWLTRQRYEEGQENVQQALNLLVDRKRLTKIKNLDGKCIYKSI